MQTGDDLRQLAMQESHAATCANCCKSLLAYPAFAEQAEHHERENRFGKEVQVTRLEVYCAFLVVVSEAISGFRNDRCPRLRVIAQSNESGTSMLS